MEDFKQVLWLNHPKNVDVQATQPITFNHINTSLKYNFATLALFTLVIHTFMLPMLQINFLEVHTL
jgi:hypothetical protein